MEQGTPLALSIALVGVLLLLEGFFSGSEMAFISLPPVKAKNNKGILFFIRNTDKLLATTLLGTNLCVIANSSLVTYLVRKHLHTENELITVALLSPLVLVFGETIPKTIARNRPELFTKVAVVPFALAYKLLLPFSTPFLAILKLLGQEDLSRELSIKREDLPVIIQPGEQSDIKEGEKELIKSIIGLREVRVKEAMKPIIQVRTLEVNHKVKTAVETAQQTGCTRFPVYEEHIYNIRGILAVFDLLDAPLDAGIKDFVKPALFVPETETVWNALRQMQEKRTPIAIVVDEYGAATGIITVEDTLEELVGEIADEYDLLLPSAKIEKVGEGVYLVPGNLPVDDLEKELGVNLPKRESYETVAGLIMFLLDRMPQPGDKVALEDVELVVKEADERKVKLVVVRCHRK